MYNSSVILNQINLGRKNVRIKPLYLGLRQYCRSSPTKIKLRKCLVVSKLSRYEFERYRNPNLSPTELESTLKQRGTDIDSLMYYHHLHKNFEDRVTKVLRTMGIEVKVVNRITYSEEAFAWSDIVVPVGGDGTFLLAASQSRGFEKPFMGLNSHPTRSEGKLCQDRYFSENVDEAFKKLIQGSYEWMYRSRIRTTLIGGGVRDEKCHPMDLHDYNLAPCCKKEEEFDKETLNKYKPGIVGRFSNENKKVEYKILPYLALNEVFMGETLSARVSHLQIQIDDNDTVTKTKSSGMCVCTGTGCTSWHMSINRLSTQDVERLLKIVRKVSPTSKIDCSAKEVTSQYNDSMIFSPEDLKMCYSIRELISIGVWPSPKGIKSRGFANTLKVSSQCIDAGLVIDGSICYPFNDGMQAVLEVVPSDALMTVNLK